MTIDDALKRNLEIFKQISDKIFTKKGTVRKRINKKELRALIEQARGDLTEQGFDFEAIGSTEAKTGQVYSLAAPDFTADSFVKPGAAAYPELPERMADSGGSAFDDFYYRLEVDARRGSQLINEGV